MANWGSGWCTPSFEQWLELLKNTTKKWMTQNEVKGRLFPAKNGQTIFLPAAGFRGDSKLHHAGSHGLYWSRSLFNDNPHLAWNLNFLSDDCILDGSGYRSEGYSVRPVRQN